MPLATLNNRLVTKNGALVVTTGAATIGFQAFDGSNRYFRRLGVYDLDCCFLEYPPLNLPRGRGDNPAISNPNDGYFIVEKQTECCCPGQVVVVESVRWYGEVLPVGTVMPAPGFKQATTVVGWAVPPNQQFVFVGIAPNPLNTPTFGSFGSGGCCNADGSKVYAELTDEIL